MSKLHLKSSLNSTGQKFLADWLESNTIAFLKVAGATKSNIKVERCEVNALSQCSEPLLGFEDGAALNAA